LVSKQITNLKFIKKIITFEPAKEIFELLKINLSKVNKAKNYNYGWATKRGSLNFYENPSNSGDFSLLPNKQRNILHKYHFEIANVQLKKIIKNYKNYQYILKTDCQGYDIEIFNSLENKLLEKTLWSVIVESSGMEDFLSEKIVSPLLAQRPFLYLSSPKTLKFLKSLGFDVFDDIIDISYDVEYDLVKRTQMFSEQVSKISNLDSDSLSDELTHRCEKNFKNVFNLVKTQNLSDDLSKCLDIIFNIERIPNKVKKLYNGT